jgi:hypothetical protein
MTGARVYPALSRLGPSAADLGGNMDENRTTLTDDEIGTGVAQEIRNETMDADTDDTDSDTDSTDSDSDSTDSDSDDADS